MPVETFDLTVPISPRMPTWPGDPSVAIEAKLRLAEGDPANVSQYTFGSHTGTHVDAPFHFMDHGLTVDKLPLSTLVGEAFIYEIGAQKEITVADLEALEVHPEATRLLLKTANSQLWAQGVTDFQPDYAALSLEGAQWIVERGIKLLGVDYLSVEAYGSQGQEVHRTLLGNGVIVVEGLDLSPLEPGLYMFTCLPLKVEGGDGAPARAIAVGPFEKGPVRTRTIGVEAFPGTCAPGQVSRFYPPEGSTPLSEL
ncbi:MAG: cyclase family protein [Anaerolineae bacterium]